LSVITHVISPADWITNEKLSMQIAGMWKMLGHGPLWLYVLLTISLLCSLYGSVVQLRKKNNLKILYATIVTYIAIFLVMDGVFLPAYNNSISIKPVAKELKETYPDLVDNVYVMNNPKEYANMYGLNFYLRNAFQDFEVEKPEHGYLVVGRDGSQKIIPQYGNQYDFTLLQTIDNKCRDGERVILLFAVQRK
jgi:hypothetical protein